MTGPYRTLRDLAAGQAVRITAPPKENAKNGKGGDEKASVEIRED